MSLSDTLATIGVTADVRELLCDRIVMPPAGVLDLEDTIDDSPARVALLATLVASLESRRFAHALKTLLRYLEGAQGELSPYDAGRFQHLRGLAAWRLDDSTFIACRALSESIRLLGSDSSPRAASYLARVHDSFGQLLHHQGILGEARRELETALSTREATGDELGTAITLGNLGRLCMDLGDFPAAADYLTRDLAIVEKTLPPQTRIRAQLLSHLGRCRLELGSIDEAAALVNESGTLARQENDEAGVVLAMLGEGHVLLRRGDARLAKDLAAAALVRIRDLDVPSSFRFEALAATRRLLADSRSVLGDAAGAVEDYRLAHADLIKVKAASPLDQAHILCGLSDALAAQDEPVESLKHLRLALGHLDATAAHAQRNLVETALKSRSYDSWLLHSAGRFIGQRHIEFLLSEAGREGFRGSRRHVATMFADIRGFTTMSERLAPDELILLLNDFLTQMTRCIELEGGMVDKFIGDAVMAIFPVAEGSTDATHGVQAALAMRDEVQRFNRRSAGMPPIALGIGIHTGDVVAGLIGSPQKREYTVIGDVVNTSSRLEGMTKQLGASILVSESVVREMDSERFLLRPLGAFSPKGRKSPIRVFDVMGERDQGPASRAVEAEIQSVAAALTLFEKREFATAAAAFAALALDFAETPKRVGYIFLQHQAEAFHRAPPEGAWAGEIALTDK